MTMVSATCRSSFLSRTGSLLVGQWLDPDLPERGPAGADVQPQARLGPEAMRDALRLGMLPAFAYDAGAEDLCEGGDFEGLDLLHPVPLVAVQGQGDLGRRHVHLEPPPRGGLVDGVRRLEGGPCVVARTQGHDDRIEAGPREQQVAPHAGLPDA